MLHNMPFSSTYVCKKAFLTQLSIKSKNRNKFDAELDSRCTLSNIMQDIQKLLSYKHNDLERVLDLMLVE